jgi:hypothetical protein
VIAGRDHHGSHLVPLPVNIITGALTAINSIIPAIPTAS